MSQEALAASFPYIIVALMLGLFGLVIGFHFGNETGARITDTKEYWRYNLIVYLITIGIAAVFIACSLLMLVFVCVGFLAGFVGGIHMGYGESLGPWKGLDRFMRKNNKKGSSKRGK